MSNITELIANMDQSEVTVTQGRPLQPKGQGSVEGIVGSRRESQRPSHSQSNCVETLESGTKETGTTKDPSNANK